MWTPRGPPRHSSSRSGNHRRVELALAIEQARDRVVEAEALEVLGLGVRGVGGLVDVLLVDEELGRVLRVAVGDVDERPLLRARGLDELGEAAGDLVLLARLRDPRHRDGVGHASLSLVVSAWRIGPSASRSGIPWRPARWAMISARTATAVSSTVEAPMSSPQGAKMRSISSSVTPTSASRRLRSAVVLREPRAPM